MKLFWMILVFIVRGGWVIFRSYRRHDGGQHCRHRVRRLCRVEDRRRQVHSEC